MRSSLRSHRWLTILLVLACVGTGLVHGAPDSNAHVEITPRTATGLPKQAVGAFAFSTTQGTIVAGGLDAQGKPVPSIAFLPTGTSEWKEFPWPEARGWGGFTLWDDALVCVGGIGANGPSKEVTKIRWDGNAFTKTALPDLPVPLAGTAAAVIKGKLYVTGGLETVNPPTATNKLWVLEGTTWKELEPMPGVPRFLHAGVSQYDTLQVFGGRTVEGGSFKALAETLVYRPVPLEGTTARGWRTSKPLGQVTAGASGVPCGQAHTMLLDGDNTPVTQEPFAISASDATQPMALYHVITDAWAPIQETLQDTGARLVGIGPNQYLAVSGLGEGKTYEIRTKRSVRNLAWQDYVIIVGYFAILAGIGAYFSRKQDSSEEFSLGNRKVAWWAAGISMFATGASAISFMAVPALAFATNLVWLFPLVIMIPGYFITSRVIYPLLRRMQIASTYEYLEHRFNRALRVIASIQCIVFQTFGRASVVLLLPSIAISATTGINVFASVLIMGVLTTIYTALGGFEAVIWTEVIQGVLKFVAPLLMIGVCIASLPGGVGEFLQVGQAYGKFDFALMTWDWTVPAVWILLLGTLISTVLGPAADQPLIQRIFSAPESEVRRVTLMFTFCGIFIGLVVNVMGLAIFAYFRAHPAQFDAGAPNDQIVPLFTTQAIPTGLVGVVIAAIFASAMATVASSMNSVATVFVEDFYMKWNPEANDKARLRTLKVTSYLVGAIGTGIALWMATMNIKSMMAAWGTITALLGGGIGGVFSLGMFSKRANGAGAVTGAIASVIVTALVKFLTPLHWATLGPIALLTTLVVGYLASFILPSQPRDLTGLTVFTPRKAAAVPNPDNAGAVA